MAQEKTITPVFSLSPNGNYFAIATDNIRKNKNSYTIRVFDAKTEKLIFKKAYQEGVKRVFEHNDLYVDNGRKRVLLR